MTVEKMKKSLLANGFRFIKLELEATTHASLSSVENSFRTRLEKILLPDELKYIRAYHDGSVDTEITLTLRVQALDRFDKIMQAFRLACVENGQMRTSNAGLHITLLTGYTYPRQDTLPHAKLEHYKAQVNKLLFGLTFLASQENKTRSFQFRNLLVSDSYKYSAIYTHEQTCLEFRLFDTCYSKPELIFNYMALIVKTLKYYTDKPQKIAGLSNALSASYKRKIMQTDYNRCYKELNQVFASELARKRLLLELDLLLNKQEKEQDIDGLTYNSLRKLMMTDKDSLKSWPLFRMLRKLTLIN